MIQIIRILFCILILLLVDPAFAYFQANHPSGNLRIDHTTSAYSTQDNIAYLLYDNAYSNNDILVENDSFSSYFVHLDRIQADLPLRLLKKNYIFNEQSIDRMLASNLKLKNLIDEYRDLNRKAELLLYNFNQAQITNKNSNKKQSDFIKAADQVNDEQKKISQILKNMSRYDSSLVMEKVNRDVVVDPNLVHADSKENASLRELYTNDVEKGIDSEMPGWDSGYDTVNNRRTKLGKSNKLPWIFEFFFKAIQYALNNRVEILLYTMFIILAGFLASLKAQK